MLDGRHCSVTLCLPWKADDQAFEQSHELISPPSRRGRSPRAQPKPAPTESDIEAVAVSRRSLRASRQSKDGNGRRDERSHAANRLVANVPTLKPCRPLCTGSLSGVS